MAGRMRGVFCASIIGVMFLSFFGIYGCAQKQDSSSKAITVWHWMTDREPAFQELAKQFQAKTGIKVIFELYAPSDTYSEKVRAAAQGNTLPDIFGVLGEKRDFASFIKAGHVLDLTPYMEADGAKWRNQFFDKALAVNEFQANNSYGVHAGFYGVPIDIMTIQMVYNKDLFKQLGLNPEKPPETFQEFLNIGAKISAAGGSASGGKKTGLQGLVSGWGELWMIDCFANNYALNIMGKDKVLATIRGEIPYTDKDWIKVLTLFKDMRETGILAEGLVTMVNKTAEQFFASNKAVFAFNGSWCVNVYKAMNPKLNYSVMLLSKASDSFPMSVWGGAGSSFMVNALSPQKEEAVQFLKWLSEKEQQEFLSRATNNLPANKECLKKMPDILGQFAAGMDYATHPNAWDVTESSMVIDTWDKGIQSIILGEKTPEQVAAETQAVKERELVRKNRGNSN